MLDALAAGLFDYAGMFPPAALSFDDALRRSAGFPATLRRPGLVGADMVLALDAMPKITPETLDAAGFERTCRACVVGFGPDRADEALTAARTAQATGSIDVMALEAADPDPCATDWAPLRDATHDLGARLYVEPLWGDDGWMGPGAQAVWQMLDDLAATGPAAGLKVRCAGPTALGDALADVLVGAVAHKIPLKATQGLHHPFPGPDRHGFLSVLVALRLAGALGLPRDDVAAVLAEDDAAAFTFDGLGWRHHRALGQRVAAAAAEVPFSIGSCSLDDPDGELAALFG